MRIPDHAASTLDRALAGRSYKTEAVVLRSFRLGEADRVLHLYTHDRGRVGAVAKGVRKTKSRFGARLEPLSHGELMLHQGSGELQTVTGVELIRSHSAVARGRRTASASASSAPRRCCGSSRAGGERARVRGADALPRLLDELGRRATAPRSTRSRSRSS